MEYKPRRKLTREFKLEAVRQVALSEKPIALLRRAGAIVLSVRELTKGDHARLIRQQQCSNLAGCFQ